MEIVVHHNAIDIVRLMLDVNVDPNKKTLDCYLPLTTAICEGSLEIMSLVLSRGADIYLKEEGFPLAMAVRKPEVLRSILGAGPDVKTYQGLIKLAAKSNNLELISILLEAGVSIDRSTKVATRHSQQPFVTTIFR